MHQKPDDCHSLCALLVWLISQFFITLNYSSRLPANVCIAKSSPAHFSCIHVHSLLVFFFFSLSLFGYIFMFVGWLFLFRITFGKYATSSIRRFYELSILLSPVSWDSLVQPHRIFLRILPKCK